MDQPPEERDFGPQISRKKGLFLGVGMIVLLVGIVLLAVFAGTPSG
jgi:hypothetical protein